MIRKRNNEPALPTASRLNSASDSDDGNKAYRSRKHVQVVLMAGAIAFLVCLLFFYNYPVLRSHTLEDESTSLVKPTSSASPPPPTEGQPLGPLNLSSFEKCAVTTTPKPDESKMDIKPFFFPQYPDSLHDSIIKSLIQQITGLAFGAKSYYAQNKRFRRCHGQGQTVACMLVHPMIPLNPPPDDTKFTSKFASDVIFALRSPTMALPLHLNGKDIKYRKLQGQTPEANWREYRDKYFEDAYDGWEKQLLAWRNLTHYSIPMYLPVEMLMNPSTGPPLILRLVTLFRSRGLDTVSDNDVPCIWYHCIGKERLEQFHRFRYEFETYTPGYTRQQIDYIAKRLAELIDKTRDDVELVAILKNYHLSTLADTRLDTVGSNVPL